MRRLSWLPRCLRFAASFASLLLALAVHPSSSMAITLVVRADGTGDVPTIQAGIDSLTPRLADDGDTLVVEAGRYEEQLVTREIQHGSRIFLVCPAGPDSTTVSSVEFPYGVFVLSGLQVARNAVLGRLHQVDRCRFLGPVSLNNDGKPFGTTLRDCSFLSDVTFHAMWSVTVERCQFRGSRVTGVPGDSGLSFRDCFFVGSGTQLTLYGVNYGTVLDRCTFLRTRALKMVGRPQPCEVVMRRCLFRDLPGAAVDSSMGAINFRMSDTRIEHCQGGVRLRGPGIGIVIGLIRDTLDTIAGPGLDLEADVIHDNEMDFIQFEDLVVRNCQGDGIRVHGVGERLNVTGCTFADNAGDGMRIVPLLGGNGFLTMSESIIARNGRAGLRLDVGGTDGRGVLVRNSLLLNKQDGVLVAGARITANLQIENNLLAGNGGAGIRVAVPYTGSIQKNDAWMNAGPAYLGVHDEPNLTEDPRFCDALAGDFHVASSSPCASSGAYGQIGALGVGCDASTVALELRQGGANSSGGSLRAAVLSHPMFDARQVDPASVRLAGASARDRHRIEDVNADGLPDFLAQFRRSDLSIPPGDHFATLEARTLYGAPIRGSDQLTMRGGRVASSASDPEPEGLALAIQSPNPLLLGGTLRLGVVVPRSGSASLRLLDVSGRIIAARDWEAAAGPQSVTLASHGLRPGIYWLRLAQLGRQVIKEVSLLR